MSTRADIERRRAYWREEVKKAAKAVDAWWNQNQRWAFENSAHLAAKNAQKFLQQALSLLAAAEFPSVENMDARIKPLVDGAYLQVEASPPKWTDPVKETWADVKETAAVVGTWGAGGAGFALVLAGLAWLWWSKGGKR